MYCGVRVPSHVIARTIVEIDDLSLGITAIFATFDRINRVEQSLLFLLVTLPHCKGYGYVDY